MLSGPAALGALLAAGCAAAPKIPDVAVMPGPGKTFQQFEADDRACRLYAEKAVPGVVSDGKEALPAATPRAAAGGLSGMGLLMGSSLGVQETDPAERGAQQSYDIDFGQCMAAYGNRLPAPPVSYYRYRHSRQAIVIFQQAPAAAAR